MKSAILTELNTPLVIGDLEVTQLKVGQVLVKVLMSGICGTQLEEIKGNKQNKKYLPHLLGHEGCGIVLEIGPGVLNLNVGDKVVMHWRKGKGIESDFPTYIFKDKPITSGKINTLTELAIVSENRLTPVDKNTSNLLCTLLGCSLSTALGVIENEAKLKFGETVAIIGCGGVGLNLIQSARLGSASKVVAADIVSSKLGLAIEAGADKFIDLANQSLDEVFSYLPNQKADVIIDTTGDLDTVFKSFKYLSNSGRIVEVGWPKIKNQFFFDTETINLGDNGKSIIFSQGGGFVPHQDIPRYLNLFNSRPLNFDFLVKNQFHLLDTNKGIEALESGLAGRVIITMDEV